MFIDVGAQLRDTLRAEDFECGDDLLVAQQAVNVVEVAGVALKCLERVLLRRPAGAVVQGGQLLEQGSFRCQYLDGERLELLPGIGAVAELADGEVSDQGI
nr:hypothetical protein [Nocardia puris]